MQNRSGAMIKPNDPDEPLVNRIAKGDAVAASMLMDRHLAAILGVACNMLSDKMEAEDVAQEVFLKAWIHAGNWQAGRARFSTWLHRVAINLCYDRLRKKREIYLNRLPEITGEDGRQAELYLDEQRRSIRVREAITSLPPRQCAAISLCHLQEMGNIEAANIMEISVEALESLLGRGRRKLRNILQGEIKELLGNESHD